ncbi:putative transcription regulator with HTH domain [Rippkaea orientalis PCC 8801]|uniref:Putative transcription regulator with HTH domain n=1 Tax=Rippkaea orientalis (strain PCC 8801 / RF-1) TaxID=41431 RepID=B7K211_RIPO1|nr:transcriptional regulator [Rippkaea orientalis]ACK64318.1 putative transcription regulator with HTH domain [Rippkaea orientalis PCC 8801]
MTLTLNKKNYLKLLEKTQIIPKIIDTQEEYEQYLAVAENLIAKKDNRTPEETALFRLLVRLIEDYEENIYSLEDFTNLSAHEILQHLLEYSNTTPEDLSNIINCSQELILALINGEQTINQQQAKLLGMYFKVDPSLFIEIIGSKT